MAFTGTKGLLVWCQRSTDGYNDVKVTNMTTSFRDGLAFCAIIHHFRPDLINFESLLKENVWENNQLAFEVAEKELNIPSLLDPDDMVALPVPDKLSIMTYVSQYYNYFKNKKGAVELGIKTSAGVGRTTVKRQREEPTPFKGKEGITPAKKSFPQNTCQVCGKKVYLVEKVVSNNKLYHRSCFKCNKCGGTLRPGAAKIGDNPAKIECQHHQDKIWNLRTNMSNRIRQKGNDKENTGVNSVWEAKGGRPRSPPVKGSPRSSPLSGRRTDTKSAGGDRRPQHPAQRPPPVPTSPPPVPTNPPSKLLHPHLSSQFTARAQFFSPSAEPSQSKVQSEAEKNQKAKAGLITTLAGVMNREEERKRQDNNLEKTKEKSSSKETLINEPPKSDIPAKALDTTTDLKPTAPGENGQNLVSQRIGMFTDNNNLKEETPKPAGVDAKPPQKDVEKIESGKQKDKLKATVQNEPDLQDATQGNKVADTKPIIGGSSGVKGMISKMEQEQNSDDQVSGEGDGEWMEGVVEGGNDIKEPVSIDSEKQDTETLEKEKLAREGSGADVDITGEDTAAHDKSSSVIDSDRDSEGTAGRDVVQEPDKTEAEGLVDEEDLDESNPFFGSEDEEMAEDQNRDNEKLEDSEFTSEPGKESELTISGTTGSDSTIAGETRAVDRSKVVGESQDQEADKNNENTPAETKRLDGQSGTDESSAAEGKLGEPEDGIADKKSEKSRDSDLDYDDSLNPFGSDDEEESSTEDSEDSDLGPNNPFANSGGEEEDDDYDESLNPFGDDDEVEVSADDPRVNPFTGSPVSDTSFEYSSSKPKPPRPPPPKTSVTKKTVPNFKTRQDVLQEMKQARNTLKQKKPAPPPPSTTPSPGRGKSTKSRRAPLPPGMTNGTAQHSGSESSPTQRVKRGTPSGTSGGSPVPSPRTPRSQKVNRPGFRPPPQPQWKTSAKRKAPAPPPQKRNVQKHHVTPAEIQQEIAEIEVKTKELETKGIELEDRLRAEMKDDTPEDSEELLMEWFEVVNEKNQMVRREGELVAQAQIQDLEIQHAEVEYEMRLLMHKQDHQKTDDDVTKEEELLELLVALVQQRSTIVDRLEEDRIREQEEDETIKNMMQMKGKLLQPEQGLDRESVEHKKEKKKKKKKHKDKTKDKEKTKDKAKHKNKGQEP